MAMRHISRIIKTFCNLVVNVWQLARTCLLNMANQVQNLIFKAKFFKKLQKKSFVRIVIPKTFCTKENIIPNNLILKYFKFGQLNNKSKKMETTCTQVCGNSTNIKKYSYT